METSDAKRIATFQQRFAQAQATEVVDLPWGFALLQRDYPQSHDHNRIVVNGAASSTDILETADAVLGGAGLRHRHISVVDGQIGQNLGADFTAAGYEQESLTVMIHRGTMPDHPQHQVQAVSVEAMRPALVRDWKIQLPDSTDEVFTQLADRVHLYARGADVTRLVVLEDDEIAARADLYVDADTHIAQFENLFTHPDYRGRGYAKSLVLNGLRRSHDAECPLSFLVADLDDWPHEWYGRLGYVPTYRTYEFTCFA